MQTKNDIAEYLQNLGYDPVGLRELPNGKIAWVHRLLFTHAILLMTPGDDSYEDRWCYTSREAAVHALQAWNPETDKEPQGWVRNPPTSRRRPDGDASKEYVAD